MVETSYYERSHKKALLQIGLDIRQDLGIRIPQSEMYRTKTAILDSNFSTVLTCKLCGGNRGHFLITLCEHLGSHRSD